MTIYRMPMGTRVQFRKRSITHRRRIDFSTPPKLETRHTWLAIFPSCEIFCMEQNASRPLSQWWAIIARYIPVTIHRYSLTSEFQSLSKFILICYRSAQVHMHHLLGEWHLRQILSLIFLLTMLEIIAALSQLIYSFSRDYALLRWNRSVMLFVNSSHCLSSPLNFDQKKIFERTLVHWLKIGNPRLLPRSIVSFPHG